MPEPASPGFLVAFADLCRGDLQMPVTARSDTWAALF